GLHRCSLADDGHTEAATARLIFERLEVGVIGCVEAYAGRIRALDLEQGNAGGRIAGGEIGVLVVDEDLRPHRTTVIREVRVEIATRIALIADDPVPRPAAEDIRGRRRIDQT